METPLGGKSEVSSFSDLVAVVLRLGRRCPNMNLKNALPYFR
jgi:hypothetical protein